MRILHVSDLHYGKHWWEQPGTAPQKGSFRVRMVDALLQLLNDPQGIHAALLGPIEAIVVSGDITQIADPKEFAMAADQLRQLAQGLGVPAEAVVVTPGNHDVSWGLSRQDLASRFDPYRDFLRLMYTESGAQRLYGSPHEEGLVALHRIGPLADGSARAVIGSVSSCLYERHEAHYGYVGGPQLLRLSQGLQQVQARWKLAVLHHHLLPNPIDGIQPDRSPDTQLDESIVRDSGMVMKRLAESGVSMVLHGHKHDPVTRHHVYGDPRAGGMYILGAGSAGVEEAELPPRRRHHAQVVVLPDAGVPTVVHLEAMDWAWQVQRVQTLWQGYSEPAALRRRLEHERLGSGELQGSTLYEVLRRVPRPRDGASVGPRELLDGVRTAVRGNTAAIEEVFRWLIVTGVLEFRDIKDWFEDAQHPSAQSMLPCVQISERGQVFLGRLWSE